MVERLFSSKLILCDSTLKDISNIVSAFDEVQSKGTSAVLFTVVSANGSTYRKAGARMLMLPDERLVGMISGGCLDSDLLLRAR